MKLTIDTATDSPEQIKQAIKLLQALLPSSTPQPVEGSFAMFDAPIVTEQKPRPPEPKVEFFDL